MDLDVLFERIQRRVHADTLPPIERALARLRLADEWSRETLGQDTDPESVEGVVLRAVELLHLIGPEWERELRAGRARIVALT